MLDSNSPDFPDTGDPDFCFVMPRSLNGIGNVELDVDTALLARGCCSRTLTPRDGQLEFAPMSPGLPVREDFPVREDCGYIRQGAASVLPFRDRPVTGSHLLRAAVSCVLRLWMPHLLFGLQP